MPETEDQASLVKLAVSVGKLEVIVTNLDKKVDSLDQKMDAFSEREAARCGGATVKNNFLDKYVRPLLFPIITGLALYWLTTVGAKITQALDAIAGKLVK